MSTSWIDFHLCLKLKAEYNLSYWLGPNFASHFQHFMHSFEINYSHLIAFGQYYETTVSFTNLSIVQTNLLFTHQLLIPCLQNAAVWVIHNIIVTPCLNKYRIPSSFELYKWSIIILLWTSLMSMQLLISKSCMLISFDTPDGSIGPFFNPLLSPLIEASIVLFAVSALDEVVKIIGPLLFLKTDGDRHLLPSS